MDFIAKVQRWKTTAGIAGVIVLGIAVVILSFAKPTAKAPADNDRGRSKQTAPFIPPASSIKVSTKNWKTYKTALYQLQYPPDWQSKLITFADNGELLRLSSSNSIAGVNSLYLNVSVTRQKESSPSANQKTDPGILGKSGSEQVIKDVHFKKLTRTLQNDFIDGKIVKATLFETSLLARQNGYDVVITYKYSGNGRNEGNEAIFGQMLATLTFF